MRTMNDIERRIYRALGVTSAEAIKQCEALTEAELEAVAKAAGPADVVAICAAAQERTAKA